MVTKSNTAKTQKTRFLFVAILVLCVVGCHQSNRISVTVETECEAILGSVEVVLGTNSEYCGSIAKEGGYTIVGVEYPVILEQAVIRFVLEGNDVSVDVPLRELTPADLTGHIEVNFSIVCSTPPGVDVTFWRFVEVDGKFTKQQIE